MALSDNLIAYVPLTANDLPFTSNGHTFTATGATYRSTAPGPAWEITSDDGNISSTDITGAAPLTLAIMVYVPSSAPSPLAFMSRTLGDSDYFAIEMTSGTADVNARARSGGTAGDATSGGSITGSAFNNFAAIYTSSTSRQLYVNGTVGSAETTSVSPTGSGQILSIGANRRISDVVQELPTGWYIKHAAAWDRALSGAELDAYFSDPASVLDSGGGSSSTITADQGSYTLTGQDAGLRATRVLSAEFGTYALTGQTAVLQKDTPGAFTLQVDAGSYSWNGQDALADYAMNAEMGSFALTGQEVTFSIGVPAAYTLSVDPGYYAYTGRNARLDWSGAPIVPNRQAGIYMGMRIGL